MNIGEVYRDKDKRMFDRHLLVIATNGGRTGNKAVCVPCRPDGRRRYADGSLTTAISAKTLASKFELVKPANKESD